MEDAEIVALYWKRDAQAIEETANKYGHYCNILGNQDDAAETHIRTEHMPQKRRMFVSRY